MDSFELIFKSLEGMWKMWLLHEILYDLLSKYKINKLESTLSSLRKRLRSQGSIEWELDGQSRLLKHFQK